MVTWKISSRWNFKHDLNLHILILSFEESHFIKIKIIMKIKGILKDQEVSLDPHGHYEMTSFDDSRYDFHLHKKTKRPIEGKERYVVIKIPLNSDRKVCITSDKEPINSIPRKLKNEIHDILDDEKTRKDFLRDIKVALKDYPLDFQVKDNVKLCVKRICIAFGFDWKKCDVEFLFNEAKANVTDEDKELYRVTLGKDKAVIEDMMMKKE